MRASESRLCVFHCVPHVASTACTHACSHHHQQLHMRTHACSQLRQPIQPPPQPTHTDVDGTLIHSIGAAANKLHKDCFTAGFKQVRRSVLTWL